jgi:hypothetical protein
MPSIFYSKIPTAQLKQRRLEGMPKFVGESVTTAANHLNKWTDAQRLECQN